MFVVANVSSFISHLLDAYMGVSVDDAFIQTSVQLS
jgi:hypothetical protein